MKPTVAFDTYWRFAYERQKIFQRRLQGEDAPWTSDPILATYRFTNVYRATDRVSQYLISQVQYRGSQELSDLFFRTLLFKLFNRVQTWELLQREHGELIPKPGFAERFGSSLEQAMNQGHRIYSAAYIMPSGTSLFGYRKKHQTHLALLAMMLDQKIPQRLIECSSMRDAFLLLRSVPTFGDFLAYQYLIDLNYTDLLNFDEDDFVVPGPGARSGIRKCFASTGHFSEPDVIRWMVDHQDEEFAVRGLCFERLSGRRLKLIDCQNLFCEVDKYCRIYHPELAGKSERSRIKQQYRYTREPISIWLPPKWGMKAVSHSEPLL